MKRWFLILFAVMLCLPAFAQSKTKARLFFSAETAHAGDTIWAGLELKMPPHWHTYWRYCGDAGLPTTVTWTLPAGVSAGDIHWPLPEKAIFTSGDMSLCTYIYEDRVVLLVPIKLDAGVKPGSLKLRAALTWLECADKGGCVPGKSELSAKLMVGQANKSSADAALIEQWRARLPQVGPAPRATAQWEKTGPGDTRTIIIDWQCADKSADFYPYEHQPSDIEGATEHLSAPPGHHRLRKVVKKYEGQWPDHLAGILVSVSELRNPVSVEVNLPLPKPER